MSKPGIVYGNTVVAAGGFFLASKGNVDPVAFVATLLGLGLVMASACVFNNFVDRRVDAKMRRTRNRALAAGLISAKSALIYAGILGSVGIITLIYGSTLLATFVAIIGVFIYVVVYGWAKRRSVHGTVVGSISGAVPPIVGYFGASGQFDGGAAILFLVLVLWQMPHFYAITVFRIDEYKAARIPVLPIVKSIAETKNQILIYIVGFGLATTLLYFYGYTGPFYLIGMLALSGWWFGMAWRGRNQDNSKLWARKMFVISLKVLMGFSILISLEGFVA